MHFRSSWLSGGLVGLAVAVTLPAWAVDGIVLIDQNRAMTGNATPGDAPGFPVSINQPGSYRLSSNLVVPDGSTTAIEINANHVTIDLNGFAILGPVDCSAGFPCANAGLQTGHGVRAGTDSPAKPYYDISVKNGTISGMGADAVHLLGDNIRVEDLRAHDNGLSGIVVRAAGGALSLESNMTITRNNIQRNGSYGIKSEAGSVTDNVIAVVAGIGIRLDFNGTVARNVVTHTGEFALLLGGNVSYIANVLSDNNGGAGAIAGGVNAGQNLCNGTICPGAQF